MDEARQIADLIRIEIKYTMGLSASVGVSFNYVFSKLGGDYKKPDATTVIPRENFRETVWPLPASDLLFVGVQRRKLLAVSGINTIGDIAKSGCVCIHTRDSSFDKKIRQVRLTYPTDDVNILFNKAFGLFLKHNILFLLEPKNVYLSTFITFLKTTRK